MTAIGWRPVAGDFRGQPLGMIERGPDDWEAGERVSAEVKRIQLRVRRSGPDFYDRCAVYLFNIGLREVVGPAVAIA
jgi:hypothetical protein